MENEKSMLELLNSINAAIDDIREHPVEKPKKPIDIILNGITDGTAINLLFSSNLDGVINNFFSVVENGDFDKIGSFENEIKKFTEKIFGPGAFQGTVSTAIINSIQSSTQSIKYQKMKSNLGSIFVTLKKLRLITKNLERQKKRFRDNKEELKKYKEAVYSIKRILKIIEKIYANRKLINKKLFKGIHNIIHEEVIEINLEPIFEGGEV